MPNAVRTLIDVLAQWRREGRLAPGGIMSPRRHQQRWRKCRLTIEPTREARK